MNLVEMAIAARMSGMSYGKYAYLVRQGQIEPPPIEEIRQKIIKPKLKAGGDRIECPVCQYDLQGEFVRSYENARQAAAAFGREYANSIHCACDGRYNSAYGFQWRYIDDEPPGVYKRTRSDPVRQEAQWVEKPCKQCGKMFAATYRMQYCSDKCKAEAKKAQMRQIHQKAMEKKKAEREYIERACAWCGTKFMVQRWGQLYCQERCRKAAGAKKYNDKKKHKIESEG